MMKATMTKTIKTMKETTAMPMKTTATQTCKHLLIQGAQRMQFFWILTHDGLFFLLIQRYTCFQNIYAPEGNSIELFGSLNQTRRNHSMFCPCSRWVNRHCFIFLQGKSPDVIKSHSLQIHKTTENWQQYKNSNYSRRAFLFLKVKHGIT